MGTTCPFCDKEFTNILNHISVRHGLSSIEDYESKVKVKEDKKIKIQAFLKYLKELTEKLRKGEISPEKLRELRAKWEKDNNLIW